jgi:hypothetical protein
MRFTPPPAMPSSGCNRYEPPEHQLRLACSSILERIPSLRCDAGSVHHRKSRLLHDRHGVRENPADAVRIVRLPLCMSEAARSEPVQSGVKLRASFRCRRVLCRSPTCNHQIASGECMYHLNKRSTPLRVSNMQPVSET